MDRFKLKWKIFAMLLGFSALMLAILALFQIALLDYFYRGIRVMQIKRDAQAIAENVTGEGLPAYLPEYLEGLAREGGVNIDIAGRDGASVFSAGQDVREAERNRAIIGRLESESDGYEFHEYMDMPQEQGRPERRGRGFSVGPPSSTLVYARHVDTAQGRLYIIVNAVISPVNATVATLRYQLIIVSGIFAILSVVIAAVVSRHVSKPLEELSAGAARLALADYGVRFSGKGFKEIVGLSDALNAAAEELGKVERLRRELIANVSHDLRTPLALIHSYAEMMRDFPDEITPEQPGTIMEEAKRLTAIVNDLLELSMLESEIGRINAAKFSLTESVAALVGRMSELLKAEGFEIVFERGEDVTVEADRPKLGRALYNLLINAVNYSGESKSVLVRQSVSENAVRISVTDYGEGIAEEELPSIWYRYYKSGNTHKRGIAGIGLGLSIVKRVMEMHGGRCGVESELGRGSTFWLELELS